MADPPSDDQPAAADAGRSPERPRITQAMEDYLRAVYHLRSETGEVTTQRLAEELGVAGPSVTNMVKRLDQLGLLRHARYQGVALTEAGERVALEVTRHHRLLERYLVETLGFGWDEVHAEADRLEHHISEELEARLDAALGHPTHDPHGDPIPSQQLQVDAPTDRALVTLTPGERGLVARVSDDDPAKLRYLGDLGLFPGVAVAVLEALPYGGSLRVRVGGDEEQAEHLVSREIAGEVFVRSGE